MMWINVSSVCLLVFLFLAGTTAQETSNWNTLQCGDVYHQLTEELVKLQSKQRDEHQQLKQLLVELLGWQKLGGSLYKFFSQKQTFAEAKALCESYGAHMVIFNSLAERKLLVDAKLGGDTRYWVGADDLATEGVWKWHDGSDISANMWSATQPDNGGGAEDCGQVYNQGYDHFLNDDECYNQSTVICEKPSK